MMSSSASNGVRLAGKAMALAVAALLLSQPAGAKREDMQPAARDTFTGTGIKHGRIASSDVAARAVNAAVKGKFADAFALSARTENMQARSLVEWLYLKQNPTEAGYDRIMAFLARHPRWPHRITLLTSAERLLMEDGVPLAKVKAHAAAHKSPVSPYGWLLLAKLASAAGDDETAAKHVRKAWYDVDLSENGERVTLKNFRSLLGDRDHEQRLARLIYAHKPTASYRAAKRLSSTHVKAAQAANALIRRRKGAYTAYKRLPSHMRERLVLRYALARYHRKKGNHASAIAILDKVPTDHGRLSDPGAFWTERRVMVRHMISNKTPKLWNKAYKYAASHGFTSGKHFAQGELLAGWVALRKLKNPQVALKHLKRVPEHLNLRSSQSEAYYWLARAYHAVGDREAAAEWYARAASMPAFFYGQVARAVLGKGDEPITLPRTSPSASDRAKVEAHPMVKTFKLLARAHGERHLGAFLAPVGRSFETHGELAAAALVVHKHAGTAPAVRFVKYAGMRGINIDYLSYPTTVLPRTRSVRDPVEKSVVYAISRQESEFHPSAKSHAGALGLMQIMPRTGKLMARKYGFRNHSTARLVRDPAYNATVGATLLGELIKSFDGSYILSFVGYNAGPGRARQWIEAYGDPRSPNVDPLDWIESVPITETRYYIKKVMQSLQVYRPLLAPKRQVSITRDLSRGQPYVRPVAASGAETGSCGNGATTIANLLSRC